MKKGLALLLGVLLVLSLSGFTGKEDPAQVYEQSMAKSLEMTNQQMDCTLEMTLRYDAQTLEMDMDLEAQVIRAPEGIQMAMTGQMELMGQQLPLEAYYLDGYSYVNVLGQKLKTQIPLEELMSLSMTQMEDLSPVPYMDKLTLEPQGKGAVLNYRIPQAGMIQYLADVLAAEGTLDAVTQQGLGMFKPGSMDGTLTVDADGTPLSETARMNLFLYVEEDVLPCTLQMAVDYSPLPADTQLRFPADLDSYLDEAALAAQMQLAA